MSLLRRLEALIGRLRELLDEARWSRTVAKFGERDPLSTWVDESWGARSGGAVAENARRLATWRGRYHLLAEEVGIKSPRGAPAATAARVQVEPITDAGPVGAGVNPRRKPPVELEGRPIGTPSERAEPLPARIA